jgi:hypothetical protein
MHGSGQIIGDSGVHVCTINVRFIPFFFFSEVFYFIIPLLASNPCFSFLFHFLFGAVLVSFFRFSFESSFVNYRCNTLLFLV